MRGKQECREGGMGMEERKECRQGKRGTETGKGGGGNRGEREKGSIEILMLQLIKATTKSLVKTFVFFFHCFYILIRIHHKGGQETYPYKCMYFIFIFFSMI